jgi:hypothetical protein
MFAVLVLMALFTTFMTTPIVMAIYKPSRAICSQANRRLRLAENSQDELRILACVHTTGNVPSLISLVDSIRSPKRSPSLKLYVMLLVELSDRSSSIMMARRTRKNGFPFINRFHQGTGRQDQIAAAFEAYGKVSGVNIRHSTAISSLATMQDDICHIAQEKRVAMIILPLHKQWSNGDDHSEEAMENVNHGWRVVNQRVLQTAPCSVAVLVDRGFSGRSEEAGPSTAIAKTVCVVLFGGPDDHEALELGGRMAENPAVKLTILRFLEKAKEEEEEEEESMEKRYSCSTVPMNDKIRDKVASILFLVIIS